jgi:PAS domain S-box-containing protein
MFWSNLSLRIKFPIIVTLITTIILSIIGLYIYRSAVVDSEIELHNLSRATLSRLVDSTSISIWNLETKLVKNIVTSELAHEDVHAVLIYLHSGDLYVGLGKKDGKVVDVKTPTLNKDLLVVEKPITFDEEDIATVRLYITKKGVRDRLNSIVKNLVMLCLFIDFILISTMIVLIILFFQKPLQRLRDGFDRLQAGEHDHQIYVANQDEIGLIMTDFNSMVRTLDEARKSLRAERDHSTGIIRDSPTIICGIASDGTTISINPAGEIITGYSTKDLVGNNWWDIFNPDDEFSQVKSFMDEFSKGELRNKEMRLVTKKREIKIIEWTSTKFLDKDGELLGAIGFGNDITYRKKAEAEAERLLKVLAAKNEELKNIIYVASHDLRSPLVNIQGFGKELTASYKGLDEVVAQIAGQLDDTRKIKKIERDMTLGRESLEFINLSANHMGGLLDGLLTISRLGQLDLHEHRISMDDLMDSIVKGNQYKIRENKIKIVVESLPSCWGDTVQISRVFTNLLDNSIKYRWKDRECLVRMSGEISGDRSIYTFSDNGPGIPQEYQNKIFKIFQRLDPESDEKGEGLGLTIVNLIVAKHGGRVWLESEEGNGTKFFVELPLHESKESHLLR